MSRGKATYLNSKFTKLRLQREGKQETLKQFDKHYI